MTHAIKWLALVTMASVCFGDDKAPVRDESAELLDSALRFAQNGEWDEALDTSLKSIQKKPTDPAYHLVSQIYLVKGDFDHALEYIRLAYDMNPTIAYKSQVRFHEGAAMQPYDKPGALTAFKESVEILKPHVDERSLEKVAIAAASLGDIPTAVTYVKELFKISPQYQFHNGIPFVRLCDKFDDMVDLARAKSTEYTSELLSELSNITRITDTAYLDVSINKQPAKRIVLGLYGLAAPKAVHNFKSMCSCDLGGDFCYKGTTFHRVLKDFIIQGGDVNPGDGTGRVNVYKRPYGDDIFALGLMHDAPGVLQIANSGADSNGGQFVIMAAPASHLNGNHVVIGKVLEGMDTVFEINRMQTDTETSKPLLEAEVVSSGLLPTDSVKSQVA